MEKTDRWEGEKNTEMGKKRDTVLQDLTDIKP